MNINLCTDLLAQKILGLIDPKRAGAFIEVGLGTMDFSFSWAAPAGFRCYAIEPLPSDVLTQACQNLGVALSVAAITGQRGEVTIYLGQVQGRDSPDTSSTNPRWWGCGQEQRIVPSLSLTDFFSDKQINTCSFLKVDTEGAELAILGNLPQLPEAQRPKVVVFEYGGGGRKDARQYGWTEEFFADTVASLKVLQELGYHRGFLIEYALAEPQFVDLIHQPSLDNLFPDNAYVGNLLLTRVPLPPETFVKLIADVAPLLADDARRDAARAQQRRWADYRTRIIAGVRRRIPWLKR